MSSTSRYEALPGGELLSGKSVTLDASTLVRGERVKLSWAPDAQCILSFLGSCRWKVEQSSHTRLRAGQELFCRQFVDKQPLRLVLAPSERHQTGAFYLCGRRGGISWERLGHDED